MFDSVSQPHTQQAGYDLVAKGGIFIAVLASELEQVEGKEKLSTVGALTFPHTRPLGAKFYAKLTELLEEGAIKVCWSSSSIIWAVG